MATLRTKRNFKSLQIPVTDPPPISSPSTSNHHNHNNHNNHPSTHRPLPDAPGSTAAGPAPTRLAPAGPQPQPTKRRPPPLGDDPSGPPPHGAFMHHPLGMDSAIGSGGGVGGGGVGGGNVNSGRHSAIHATLAKMELQFRGIHNNYNTNNNGGGGGGGNSNGNNNVNNNGNKGDAQGGSGGSTNGSNNGGNGLGSGGSGAGAGNGNGNGNGNAGDGVEVKDVKNADLKNLKELGQGNGGSVMLVEHVPSGVVMAKKIVLIDAKPTIRKQILRELQIMHSCKSPFIVSSYGAFLAEPNICICMEYMDKGSFDGIYKMKGPIEIEVVGRVARAVLEGLMYLYDVHRIIHRDIKPSNILCNSQGEIKLCDFGVSGELINSIAHTFVGTSIYMSPERIQGAEYSVKSDVWSLGISLVELALGRFPFYDASLSDDEDNSDLENGVYGDRLRDDDDDDDDDNDDGDDDDDNDGNGGGGEGNRHHHDYHKTTKQPPLPQHQHLGVPLSSSSASATSSNSSSAKTAKGSSSSSSKTNTNINPSTHTNLSPPSSVPPLTSAPGTGGTGKKRKSKGVSLHGGGMTMSIIELMHQIVKEPAPRLNPPPTTTTGGQEEKRFPNEADEFVQACLLKDPEVRKAPKELLAFEWMDQAQKSTFDLKEWTSTF